jgi:hypothetical protein
VQGDTGWLLSSLVNACVLFQLRSPLSSSSPLLSATAFVWGCVRCALPRMLVSWGECASFTVFLAMVIIIYYHIYLATLGMDRESALF